MNRVVPILLLTIFCVPAVYSLNIIERNELSRKFKYYFRSVRPVAPENILSNQISLSISLILLLSFVDDRLVLRDLTDKFEMPSEEFNPWLPRMSTSPPLTQLAQLHPSIYLSPSTGRVSLYYKWKTVIGCTSRSWKHPFEKQTCVLRIENGGAENPFPTISFTYSSSWMSALISVYLPSFLIFTVVLFAQWKRRKIQLSSREEGRGVSLMDLWLCSTFLHIVTLLVIDLTLPARRVRYTLLLDVNSSNQYHPVTNGIGDSSPVLGGQRAFMAVQKYATKKFGTSSVETKVMKAPNNMPVQRQVATSSIGKRKRFALTFTLISYTVFCLIYFLIIASID